MTARFLTTSVNVTTPVTDSNDTRRYTPATVWAAEGARVGLATCERCGAALLVDPRTSFDVFALHDAFHEAEDRRD